MLSILAIAESRWAPRARAEGSLNDSPSVAVAVGPAGVGVAGAFDVVFEAGTGAAGVAGVCVVVGAGVDGVFEVEDDAAWAVLG